MRRYGLYSSRSLGTWMRKPHLVRLAPEGWKQQHSHQPPPPMQVVLQDSPQPCVPTRESRSAWARLLANLRGRCPALLPLRLPHEGAGRDHRSPRGPKDPHAPHQDRRCPSGRGGLLPELTSPSPLRFSRQILVLDQGETTSSGASQSRIAPGPRPIFPAATIRRALLPSHASGRAPSSAAHARTPLCTARPTDKPSY
jgi:hypothetical protein